VIGVATCTGSAADWSVSVIGVVTCTGSAADWSVSVIGVATCTGSAADWSVSVTGSGSVTGESPIVHCAAPPLTMSMLPVVLEAPSVVDEAMPSRPPLGGVLSVDPATELADADAVSLTASCPEGEEESSDVELPSPEADVALSFEAEDADPAAAAVSSDVGLAAS
jgi:hypothetical protein